MLVSVEMGSQLLCVLSLCCNTPGCTLNVNNLFVAHMLGSTSRIATTTADDVRLDKMTARKTMQIKSHLGRTGASTSRSRAA